MGHATSSDICVRNTAHSRRERGDEVLNKLRSNDIVGAAVDLQILCGEGPQAGVAPAAARSGKDVTSQGAVSSLLTCKSSCCAGARALDQSDMDLSVTTSSGYGLLHELAKVTASADVLSQAMKLLPPHPAGRCAHDCDERKGACCRQIRLMATLPQAVGARLIDLGCDPNVASTNCGVTPLMVAAGEGKLQFANLLVLRGADVNALNDDGQSFIHEAAMNDHRGVLQCYRSHRELLALPDAHGLSPLAHALQRGHLKTARWLLAETKAEVDAHLEELAENAGISVNDLRKGNRRSERGDGWSASGVGGGVSFGA